MTGPAGSGKSTTLACIIDHINHTADKHIITLEDPLEYLHRHDKSIVSQREINTDTESYVAALRAALRQSPDVILLGEMRDYETMQIAMTAAETGHLVFSTLHTIGAANTIDRIIDVFPANQQQQISVQLSMTLQAVISQQFVPDVDGHIIPAFEFLTMTPAVRNMIRDNKVPQIDGMLYSAAGSDTMYSMDTCLAGYYRKGNDHPGDGASVRRQPGNAEKEAGLMRYYIADCHFFHENLNTQMDRRGFPDAAAMNDYMIRQWNRKVRDKDEVVILGDFSLGTAEQTNQLLEELNGRKYLILGNHDGVVTRRKFRTELFEWIRPYEELHDQKRKVILSHYPILCYNGQYRLGQGRRPVRLHAVRPCPRHLRPAPDRTLRRLYPFPEPDGPERGRADGALPAYQLLLHVFRLHASYAG